MEVRLQPEKKAQLAEIAAQRGPKADELAQPVLSDYLEDNRFIEAVNVGLAAAEHGEFVEHEEGGRKLKQILRPNARVLDYPRR